MINRIPYVPLAVGRVAMPRAEGRDTEADLLRCTLPAQEVEEPRMLL